MVSIRQDLWFNNGDKSVHLADGGISSEPPGVFLNGLLGRAPVGIDLKNSSPFGESASHGVVFFGSFIQSIKSGSPGFFMGSVKNL